MRCKYTTCINPCLEFFGANTKCMCGAKSKGKITESIFSHILQKKTRSSMGNQPVAILRTDIEFCNTCCQHDLPAHIIIFTIENCFGQFKIRF